MCFYVRVFMKSKFFRSSGLCFPTREQRKQGQKNEIFGDLDFPLIVDDASLPQKLKLGRSKNTQKREQKLNFSPSLFVCLFVPSLSSS